MTRAHNALLRGLNSILLQAPNVPSAGSEGYRSQDVKDLLSFVRCWIKMVNHHHAVEEEYIFPAMAEFSADPNLLETPQHEHGLFQDGLKRLLAYTEATRPEEYRWEGGMKDLMDAFSKHLTNHLYAEIDLFMGFHTLDSEGYREVWQRSWSASSQAGNLREKLDMMVRSPFPMSDLTRAAEITKYQRDILPCVYGCADKTYEGGDPFPAMHWTMEYVIKYWFAHGNGAWRYNPSDWERTPRPLLFGLPIE